jgi:hypothetical protein
LVVLAVVVIMGKSNVCPTRLGAVDMKPNEPNAPNGYTGKTNALLPISIITGSKTMKGKI